LFLEVAVVELVWAVAEVLEGFSVDQQLQYQHLTI
jgi:hypothetical protein